MINKEVNQWRFESFLEDKFERIQNQLKFLIQF